MDAATEEDATRPTEPEQETEEEASTLTTDEFDDEMIEYLKNDLLAIAQRLLEEDRFVDDGKVLLRVARYLLKLEKEREGVSP